MMKRGIFAVLIIGILAICIVSSAYAQGDVEFEQPNKGIGIFPITLGARTAAPPVETILTFCWKCISSEPYAGVRLEQSEGSCGEGMSTLKIKESDAKELFRYGGAATINLVKTDLIDKKKISCKQLDFFLDKGNIDRNKNGVLESSDRFFGISKKGGGLDINGKEWEFGPKVMVEFAGKDISKSLIDYLSATNLDSKGSDIIDGERKRYALKPGAVILFENGKLAEIRVNNWRDYLAYLFKVGLKAHKTDTSLSDVKQKLIAEFNAPNAQGESGTLISQPIQEQTGSKTESAATTIQKCMNENRASLSEQYSVDELEYALKNACSGP